MSIFDLKLPQAAGNALSNLSAKLQESATKVVQSFGGVGPFTKVASGVDTKINDGAASVQQLIAEQSRGKLTQAEKDAQTAVILADLGGSKKVNAMTVAAADTAAAKSNDSVSAASLTEAMGFDQKNDHIVRLEQIDSGIIVAFDIMPEVAESRTVEYEPVAPPQSPGAFQKYKGTSSTQWSVNATLSSRTTDEATRNLRIINQLRGWTMPYFGERTAQDYPSKIGAPPPVLKFSGYRNQMIGPVSVVITSLNWQFTPDCDYIPAREFAWSDATDPVLTLTGNLIPFPTVIKVAIQLVESFSTDQFNGFSLADFRIGQSEKAWSSMPGAGTSTKRDARNSAGGAMAAEPAQQVLPNSLRGGGGYPSPPNAGRGIQGAPSIAELEAYRNRIPQASYSNEGRNNGVPITERAVVFKSGNGGDFGGGGASGTF